MPIEPPSTARLEAFTDAVIAIALTIMVLELHSTDILGAPDMHSVARVFGPKILIYALSFVVILRIWINHHRLMEIARHSTTALFWLNGLLLFWVSLIPIATALVGSAPTRPLSAASYGTVIAFTSASLTILRYYVLSRLARCGAEAVVAKPFTWLSAAVFVPYAIAVPMAFARVEVALAIFISTPLFLFAMDALFPARHGRNLSR
jgi:TMEM175 potassium channel family protein